MMFSKEHIFQSIVDERERERERERKPGSTGVVEGVGGRRIEEEEDEEEDEDELGSVPVD
jgi:hypothetical protein